MRILIYEHFTATADRSQLSLWREGSAMLQAVAEDFGDVAGVEVLQWESDGGDPASKMFRAAREVDAVFIIAPESDGVLCRLCRAVENGGGNLLGPSTAAVALTSDKLALARHLRDAGVLTPLCWQVGECGSDFPLVCKPQDGAGSQATFLVRNEQQLQACIDLGRSEGFSGEYLLQSYVPGVPASVSLLLGSDAKLPLLPTRQLLSDDGRFHYLGCEAPLCGEMARRAVALALAAVGSIPGLSGYVGVDLILGDPEDGSGDRVIEINPRLTTSFLALRRLTDANLIGCLLDLRQGKPANVAWNCQSIRFDATAITFGPAQHGQGERAHPLPDGRGS